MKKIYLAAIRDLWFHRSRSVVLVLALVMVTAFPIAFLDLPYNLENIIEEEQNEYGLAHLNIFFNELVPSNTSDIVKSIIIENTDYQTNDFIVESRLHLSSKMPALGKGELDNDSWINIDVISLDTEKTPQINQVVLISGKYPETKNEAIMLESQAKIDGAVIGDIIDIYSYSGKKSFIISGFIKSIEYSSYQLSQFGLIMLNENGMRELLELEGDLPSSSIPVFFKSEIEIDSLIEISEILEQKLNEYDSFADVALIWFVRETSFREGLQDALELTAQYMYAASLFIFLVAGVIIYTVMNRYINEQKTTLGAIYSYGVRKRNIFLSYILRIFILSIIGISIGLIIAKQMITFLVNDLVESWGLINTKNDFSSTSILFTVISSAVVTYSFTIIAVSNLLKLTPYEAMRGKTSELKNRGFIFAMVPYIPLKILRNGVKNLTRNRTRTALTIIAFTLALSFAWSLAYTNESVPYTIDDYYENNILYDLELNIGYENVFNFQLLNNLSNIDGIDNFEPYINSLVQMVDLPEKLTFLMAYDYNTTMFNTESILSEGNWFTKNSSNIVISRYIAGSFGYDIGSEFRFRLHNIQFNGTVVGIANELVSSSSIIMDIDYISDIINPFPNESPFHSYTMFNKILATVEEGYDPVDIQNRINREYPEVVSVFTSDFYHQRFTSLANSQSAIIIMMSTLGLFVGAVSIFTTLLIAIVEREKELALLQVFGYSQINLLIQIMIEGLIIGIISVISAFFLAKLIALNLWMAIVNGTLFELLPYFSRETDIQIISFAIISIIIAIIPSFKMATKKKLVEVLREE